MEYIYIKYNGKLSYAYDHNSHVADLTEDST